MGKYNKENIDDNIDDVLNNIDIINPVEISINKECDSVKKLLISKNRKYGNSALSPQRVFSKSSNIEQLLVRIDDKLSRIKTSGTNMPDEDTVQDLIGYLILLKIAQKEEVK